MDKLSRQQIPLQKMTIQSKFQMWSTLKPNAADLEATATAIKVKISRISQHVDRYFRSPTDWCWIRFFNIKCCRVWLYVGSNVMKHWIALICITGWFLTVNICAQSIFYVKCSKILLQSFTRMGSNVRKMKMCGISQNVEVFSVNYWWQI